MATPSQGQNEDLTATAQTTPRPTLVEFVDQILDLGLRRMTSQAIGDRDFADLLGQINETIKIRSSLGPRGPKNA